MSTNLPLVLITGASRGIGLACLKVYAQNGYRVIGTSTTDGGVDSLNETLDKANLSPLASSLKLNITSQDSIDNCMASLKSTYNELPLIVINNAGITDDNIFLRMKQKQWEDVITTNLTGAFMVSKLALRAMLKNKWGRLINISSVVGQRGNKGQANYCAAKAGLEGMTRSLAIEYATTGITCNLVAPGFIETDMTMKLNDAQKESILSTIPMAKLGSVNDIAKAVLFLSSPDAGYITGQTLHVNGGMYMG